MQIDILLDEGAFMPRKAYDTDAGFDLFTPFEFTVKAGDSAVVDTGVHMVIPSGYCGLIVSKSGLNTKYDIKTTGLVDSGYTGSIVIKVQNHGHKDFHFHRSEKISQIVILPVPEATLNMVDTLPDTERGANGFGSTGKF